MNPSLSILIPVRDEKQNIQIITEEIKQKIGQKSLQIIQKYFMDKIGRVKNRLV